MRRVGGDFCNAQFEQSELNLFVFCQSIFLTNLDKIMYKLRDILLFFFIDFASKRKKIFSLKQLLFRMRTQYGVSIIYCAKFLLINLV